MRQISVIMAVLFFSVFCGGVWGQLPENDSKELWTRLQEAAADPGKQTVERWTLVEGCPLVKQIEGVLPEYAAAASVLESYNEGGYGLGPLFEGDGRVVIFMNKYLGTDPVRAKVRKKCIEAYRERTIEWKGLFEKAEAQIRGPKFPSAPKGIATSVLLQEMAKALPGDNALEKVLTKMYEERLYVSVMRREPCNFEVARSLLENGVPFILFVKAGEGAQTRLCVGCVEANGKRYFIAADPVSVPLGRTSLTELEILPEKESENPRVRENVEKTRQANLALDEMFGKIPYDMEFSLETAPEMARVEFVEWRQDLEMLNIPVPRISPMRIKSFCRDVGKYSDSSQQ